MAEHIEREVAIRCVANQCVDGKMWGNEETEGTLVDAYELMDDLSDIPSADVAPVVRCKDCANFRQNASGVCWCDEYGGSITPNDYCSRAVTDKQPRASIPWEAD